MSDCDLECPYCEAELEVCHDDGFGYAEDEAHEMHCHACDRNFIFHTHISYNYYPEKADCLNGADHPFGKWHRLWVNEDTGKTLEERVCKTCNHRERRNI